jgi:hypothetical protein
MTLNKTSLLAAAVVILGMIGSASEAKADPGKPYRFDVRNLAAEVCRDYLPRPVEYVEGSDDACRAAYRHCISTLADMGVQTADYKKFYREEAYVYDTSAPEYLVFYDEFRKSHLAIKMVRFDDYGGAEVPMMTSFESTLYELKSDIGSACKMTLIFPMDPCGNGVKDPGEYCDDGPDNGKPGKCPDTCQMAVNPFFRFEVPIQKYNDMMLKK